MLTPWVLLVGLVAGANWAAFLLVRGRWGRSSILLAAASIAGTVIGDAIGGRIGLEPVRIGAFHLVSASLVAQLAMLMVGLLGALAPTEVE